VPSDVQEAADGMGMSPVQRFWRVELPLALPVVASGVRLALVQVWATATIAALVAGPGLGRIITEGFARNDYAQGMAGAVVVAVVALVLELVAAAVQRAVDPMPRGPSPDRDDGLSVPSSTVAEAPTGS
jgi:osmoprotectant transport system permease protein